MQGLFALLAAGLGAAAACIWIRARLGRLVLVLDERQIEKHGLLGTDRIAWHDLGWIELDEDAESPAQIILHPLQPRHGQTMRIVPEHMGLSTSELIAHIRRFCPDVPCAENPGQQMVARQRAREQAEARKDAEFHQRTQRLIDDQVQVRRSR